MFLGNVLLSEVEEARLLLDTADRARKHVDAEISEVRENMANLSTTNSIISTDKRRLEGDLRGMQQELDNFMNQIKNSEEKTKKAMADAGNSILKYLITVHVLPNQSESFRSLVEHSNRWLFYNINLSFFASHLERSFPIMYAY